MPERVVVRNRRARHDYDILETYEAGIVLKGTEVKSLREGRASIQDAYAKVEDGEVWLHQMHISPYERGGRFNHDPKRPRKLLLHKYEIKKLMGRTQERGFTLVPLKVYFNDRGIAKLELALAKGKKLYDRRREIARRVEEREIERALRRKG
ncbi:MAG TPA: SsrA-binding protein SmpB [Candidatus Latescibacteria bacterium]|nr:SsrA-binding protein SmpB [Candidatus Latescibacterota bacterium]